MPESKFGSLTRIDPAKIWGDERSFSAWLIENFNVLSDEIHIEVEDLEAEVSVGPFKCDIIGVDRDTQKLVIVEYQYGMSNHDHLGKLLTYAAGKDAGVVVWIAEDFRDEHLSVLKWLNGEMENSAIFGVKLEVIKIDDSKPLVSFKVLSKPDEWQRTVRTERLSDRKRLYLDYFSRLLERLKTEIPKYTTLVRARPRSWLQVRAGRSRLNYIFSFTRENRYRIELFIKTGDKERNKAIFDTLHSQKDKIEGITGPLEWDRLDDNNPSRIYLFMEDTAIVDDVVEDPEKLEDTLSWSVENAKKFKKAFAPLIKNL